MSKARDLANLISQGNPLSDGAISVSEISDLTASAAELNKLDGVTASTAELNQVVGATSALQTQLDNISVTSGSLTKTFVQNETADITLSQGITSAPVVSATKEVPQTGVSTKGNWDVNSTASNYDFHNTAANVTLTPVGFNISNYSNKKEYSLNTSQAGSAYDIFFKPDGTKMFLANGGGSGTNNLVTYNLSTAWDVTTASYDASEVYDTSSTVSYANGLWFKPDGTYVYLTNNGNSGVISYYLTTAWDVSTASSLATETLTSMSNDPRGINFKPDGTKMFVGDPNNKVVREYALSTAWDITTSSLTSTFDARVGGTGDAQMTSITFNSDGTQMHLNMTHDTTLKTYSLTEHGIVCIRPSYR